MNRIDTTLAALQASGKKMLSPYITAGDPTPDATVKLMHGLVKGGADILEIGIPFSDPMAEGPVIQAAMERALVNGVHCDEVFAMIKAFRRDNNSTPIILMGYVNPVEYYGYESFAKRAVEAGVDGTILVDLPPEESADVQPVWDDHGLYSIYLCSPTTSAERMSLINRYAKGYLYYVSLKGVTGSSDFELNTVKEQYQQRKKQTSLPLMTGFGIKTAQLAADVAQFADGVIVGAGLISEIMAAHDAKKDIVQAASSFMESMRKAIDNR